MIQTGVLCSYYYFRRKDLAGFHDVPLIIDSGAFSAYTCGGSVDVDEYGRWILGLSRPYEFAFNLDVLGDAPQSLSNWRYLRSLGVSSVPVLHFGTRPHELVPYLDEGADRLALGGLVAGGGGSAGQATAWTAHVFKWLQDHGLSHIPVHGLGVHMRSPMARFPWGTTDSSTSSMAWRRGRLSLWTLRRRWVTLQLDGRSVYRYSGDVRSYGFEPEDISVSNGQTKNDMHRFTTRIEARAANENPRQCPRFIVSTDIGMYENMAGELVK